MRLLFKNFFVFFSACLMLACSNGADNGVLTAPKIQALAHAGGGVDGKTYTNSYEALNTNIAKGFKLFELDFSWTADDHLVCIHDWTGNFERTFGFSSKEIPTFEIFEFLSRNATPYQNCTLGGLNQWLQENPKAIIVTDVKKDNLKALQLIADTVENFELRFIPQIYLPEEYSFAHDMGYQHIIWTLYRFSGNSDKVIAHVEKMNLFAVTMPRKRVESGLAKQLKKKQIPTYVHTINKQDEAQNYFDNYAIDGIYTDFLAPN